ncbi:phosphotransferase [Amycolatopsis sp. M39]|uniref:phosphotransferase n=1 Tax=Amycolatopsis TaxID=1813 RepID=UPI00350ECA5A
MGGGWPEKEPRWLLRLAPHLPLAIPGPVALGSPGEGYPWHWPVSRWLPGPTAAELTRFVAALQRLPARRRRAQTGSSARRSLAAAPKPAQRSPTSSTEPR